MEIRFSITGFNPSEKSESQLGFLFPIYGKIKHVPNHQQNNTTNFCLKLFNYTTEYITMFVSNYGFFAATRKSHRRLQRSHRFFGLVGHFSLAPYIFM